MKQGCGLSLCHIREDVCSPKHIKPADFNIGHYVYVELHRSHGEVPDCIRDTRYDRECSSRQPSKSSHTFTITRKRDQRKLVRAF